MPTADHHRISTWRQGNRLPGSLWPLAKWLQELANRALQLVYVPSCAFCGRSIHMPKRLCRGCERSLVESSQTLCHRCGMPRPSALTSCVHCRIQPFWFDQVITTGPYSDARQQAVIRMKHATDHPLVWAAADMLSRSLTEQMPHCDLVTCVPSHWQRRWSRGFWPTGLLAQQVAHRLRLPFRPALLRMVRATRKQGTLLPNQRQQNVRGAFRVHPRINLTGLQVLLIDDVMTTGATVNELSRILKKSGAKRITVGVFARGTGSR